MCGPFINSNDRTFKLCAAQKHCHFLLCVCASLCVSGGDFSVILPAGYTVTEVCSKDFMSESLNHLLD